MSESDAESDTLKQIDDPEAYVNQRRLEQLFDIREHLHDTRLEIAEIQYTDSSGRSRWDATNAYRALVDSYIMELEPILLRYEPGPELLTQKNYGTLRVTPRYKNESTGRDHQERYVYEPSMTQNADNWVKVENEPDDILEYDLTGLRSVLNLPSPLQATYEFRRKRHTRAGEEFTHVAKAQISMETLDSMVRDANNFLAEIGFTVEPEGEGDEWEV